METELLKMQEKHKSHIEELQSHVEGLQAGIKSIWTQIKIDINFMIGI